VAETFPHHCGGTVAFDRNADAWICQGCGYTVPIVPKTKADRKIANKCGFTLTRPADGPEVIDGHFVERKLGSGKG
jgi:ribosomal protein S27E